MASLLIAALLSTLCISVGDALLWPGFFFFLLAVESWQALRGRGEGMFVEGTSSA